MSGICGIFSTDDSPVPADELRSMTAMLTRHGPERTAAWQHGAVGLGHSLLATTPELTYERQPFRHVDTGCVITADVRLDNRQELLAALNRQAQITTTGDAELILLAYLAWGDACVERLLGDFAFAIWDARDRRMFCARDHSGMRPFYYHHRPGRVFVFASDARAILVLPRVPYRINLGRVADFIVQRLQWIDYTSTFFEEVVRLPPGHRLSVTAASCDVAEYWRPMPLPDPGFTDDEQYRDGFREVFGRAVDARLRTASGSAASMLSGGMDSGSVAATAADLLGARNAGPLVTFSATTRPQARGIPDSSRIESQAIDAPASIPGISPTFVYPDELGADFDTLISGNAEPFDSDFMFMKAIYLAAHRQGEKVLLDGGGGDVVLLAGHYIVRLIRQLEIRQALAEIAAEPGFWGNGSFAKSLVRYARSAVMPNVVREWIRPFRRRRYVRHVVRHSLISDEFAASVDLPSRFERQHQTNNDGWVADYAMECCNRIRPCVTAGRERYARLAAGLSVEACDPFLDRRVIDFCSTLPGRFRLQDGWPKMILRDLMTGKLPDEVLWCRQKPHLGWLFNAAVTKEAVDRGQLNLEILQQSLPPYVDAAALADAWELFAGGGDAEQIHQAYVLSVWLREASARPTAA